MTDKDSSPYILANVLFAMGAIHKEVSDDLHNSDQRLKDCELKNKELNAINDKLRVIHQETEKKLSKAENDASYLSECFRYEVAKSVSARAFIKTLIENKVLKGANLKEAKRVLSIKKLKPSEEQSINAAHNMVKGEQSAKKS